MAITELPTERSKIASYNPSLIVLYGVPKCGKSTLMAHLDDNLILDFEDGYRALSVMKIQVRTAQDLFQVKKLLANKAKELGKIPYKYITLDNATRLEEVCLPYAAHLYRQTPMGMRWKMLEYTDPKTKQKMEKPDPNADVRQLPNGAGWGYIRDAIKEMVNMFKPYCETLILVGHVKDKMIKKEGEEISEMQLDLAGKSSTIICGEADAIGLIYRKGNSTYISFENSGVATNEARPLHLRGRKFEVIKSDGAGHMKVDLSQVFPDSETLEKITEEALALQSAPLLEETESK
jgi:hypothetical protein